MSGLTDLGAARSMIVHQCPRNGEAVMPCCGRTPFEVDPRERMTNTELVTCPIVPALVDEVERLRTGARTTQVTALRDAADWLFEELLSRVDDGMVVRPNVIPDLLRARADQITAALS